MQKLLMMETEHPTLRSKAIGWSNVEDPRLVVLGKPIGMTPSSKDFYQYETVLHAMAEEWHLLSAPEHDAEGGTAVWWLVKEI